MSNWKSWPPDDPNTLNWQLGNVERVAPFRYPDIRDDSPLILASDYSGEHSLPDFRVLSFLLTSTRSVMTSWKSARLESRRKHMPDGRRMSFKALNDARRMNALSSFLTAASQLSGVLVCVAIDKAYSLVGKVAHPPLQHDWAPSPLKKMLEICVFGGEFVNGLRGNTQDVRWITDDDAIVATDAAVADSMMMGGVLRQYPDETPQLAFGIASKFMDDERRAEDLVAIPDLAAGAFSETLTLLGRDNIPTAGSGPMNMPLFAQVKTSLINVWRHEKSQRLRHLSVVVRPGPNGGTILSYGMPFVRLLREGESAEGAPAVSSKWHRALAMALEESGADPVEILRSMGIEPKS